MFTLFTVLFSRERPVAGRQIILSSSHMHRCVIAPSKAGWLDFLPSSPSPGSPLESTKYYYFSDFFVCISFNVKDLIWCEGFVTGFQKCVLKHRYCIWGCKVKVCKCSWNSVEGLNTLEWVEMLAISSILPSVNGTGKLHFPGSVPDTRKYWFLSTCFY